jgi:hypothetical protein
VLDPVVDWAVILDNAGPYLVVDNQFRLSGATRAVRMTWADQTLVGNVYSRPDGVEERGRFRVSPAARAASNLSADWGVSTRVITSSPNRLPARAKSF